MLQVSHISKSYGGQTVLEDVSLIVNRGEHVGLIGPNGCGKTTLLRIIMQTESPDSGRVHLAGAAGASAVSSAPGYLPQGLPFSTGQTLGEYLATGVAGYQASRRQVELLAAQMAQDAAPDAAQEIVDAYGQAYARFEALGGYGFEHRIEQVKAGLGLDAVDPSTLLDTLSGGQRTRAGLARLLLAGPALLLLDEPTNHLDIPALEWLEEFLSGYVGAAIIVSHDWTFLDATVSRILELDPRTHQLTEYAGNYSSYAEAKASELEKQWGAWKDQQDEIIRLKSAAAHLRGLAQFRKGGKADSGDKFAKGFFANRGMETMRRAKRIEARLEELTTEQRVDKPQSSWQIKLDFGAANVPRGGQVVIALQDVGQSFGKRWLFRNANLTLRHGERIALVGSNGTGKTTLLRIIMGELTPSEGQVRIGASVRLGYMPQEQEILDPDATPLNLIRQVAPMDETAARHFLHFFLFAGDDVFVPVGKLSYGERSRLVLARLVAAGANCLVLDEPVNHLDIPSRDRFESALDAFPGTILITTHDRAFIDRFATGIWSTDGGVLRAYVDREAMGRQAHVIA